MTPANIRDLIGRLGAPTSETMDLKGNRMVIERTWGCGCFTEVEDERGAAVKYEPCPEHMPKPEPLSPRDQRLYGPAMRVIEDFIEFGWPSPRQEFACGCSATWNASEARWQFTLDRVKCDRTGHWL